MTRLSADFSILTLFDSHEDVGLQLMCPL